MACDKCNNTGFVDVSVGNYKRAAICECRNPALNNRALRVLLENCGLGRDELVSVFTPQDESHSKLPQDFLDWCSSLAGAKLPSSLSRIILGPPGVGKTRVAAIGAAHFLRALGQKAYYPRKKLMFCHARSIVESVIRQKRTSVTSDAEDQLSSSFFLIVDDLGVKLSEYGESLLAYWISEHVRMHKPLVVTSNARSLDQLGDGRIVSRLSQGKIIDLSGLADYRTSLGG